MFSCGTATIALGVAVVCFAIGGLAEFANQTYVQGIPANEVDIGQIMFCGFVNAASSLISFGFARLSSAYENVVGNVWQRLLSTLKPTADNIGEGLSSGLLSGGFSSFGMIAGALYQALKELFK